MAQETLVIAGRKAGRTASFEEATLSLRRPVDDDERAALRWANRRRAQKGRPPLEALPFGLPSEPEMCPLARATGDRIETLHTFFWGRLSIPAFIRYPRRVRRFVRNFDNRRARYSHLRG